MIKNNFDSTNKIGKVLLFTTNKIFRLNIEYEIENKKKKRRINWAR